MNSLILYLALFGGVILEGEAALFGGSLAAQNGIIDIYIVWAIAYFATLLADWSYFFIGKYNGLKILKKLGLLNRDYIKRHHLIERYPYLVLFFYRYLYGFRIATLVYLGMSRFSVKLFLSISLLSIFVWASVFTLISYYLSEFVLKIIAHFELTETKLIIIIAIVLVLVLSISKLVNIAHQNQKKNQESN
ncbi:MAG TPA: VTT domain-containing protein [Bacteroidales bacterium]|nr:VTT domain-containing protein [Bacteroidales bacterium]HRX98256.1 VTT domain-containing protein [Bacteroidales bacterium]